LQADPGLVALTIAADEQETRRFFATFKFYNDNVITALRK
jgi:hypothetical protein